VDGVRGISLAGSVALGATEPAAGKRYRLFFLSSGATSLGDSRFRAFRAKACAESFGAYSVSDATDFRRSGVVRRGKSLLGGFHGRP
jgi:hypothetical protein